MAEENRAAAAAPGHPGEKFVAGHPAGCFQRLLLFASSDRHVHPFHLKLATSADRQTLNKSCIRRAGAATQLVIEMADHQPPVAQIKQLMQQHDRIAAAGNANEIGAIWRKRRERLELERWRGGTGSTHWFYL
jgi:hypothetical protein